MERFLYHIHPRRPIVGIIPGKGIRKPMAMKLTKEEVRKCMNFGPVYRAFPTIPPIRVTGSLLDSLHVTEDEYLSKKDTTPVNYTENAVEEQIQESVAPEEPKTEAPTEEIIEEKQVHVETTETENEDGTYTYDTVLVETPAEPVVVAPESVIIETSKDDNFVEDAEEKVEESEEVSVEENTVVPNVVSGVEIAPQNILQPSNNNNQNYNKKKHKNHH